MKKYKVLIIENDSNSLENIQKIIDANFENITLSSVSSSVDEAVETLVSLSADIVVANINSNEKFIFDILNRVDYSKLKIIFISHNEQSTFASFKYFPVDYLITPINSDALLKSLNRSLWLLELEQKRPTKKPNKVRNSESQTQNKILGIGNLDSVDLLHISEIMYIRAEGKYTEFYMSDGKKFVSSKNIGIFIAILDPKCFFRVHHSYCVNINFITKINKKDGLYCEMKLGLTVPISIRKTEEFNRFILLKVK